MDEASRFRSTRTFAIIAALVVTCFMPSLANAQTNGFGLGVILGDPTGVSAKLWLSGRTAFAGGLAWSFRGPNDGSLHIHGDYLFHKDLTNRLGEVSREDIGGIPMFYFGIGGRLQDEPADDKLSIRFPLGYAHGFSDAPFDFFIEAVPLLDVAPETDFDMNAALGFRFFF